MSGLWEEDGPLADSAGGDNILVPNIVVASLVGADGCTTMLASLGWEQEQEPRAGAEAGAAAGPEVAGAGASTSSSSEEGEAGGRGGGRKKDGVDTVLGQWD